MRIFHEIHIYVKSRSTEGTSVAAPGGTSFLRREGAFRKKSDTSEFVPNINPLCFSETVAENCICSQTFWSLFTAIIQCEFSLF